MLPRAYMVMISGQLYENHMRVSFGSKWKTKLEKKQDRSDDERIDRKRKPSKSPQGGDRRATSGSPAGLGRADGSGTGPGSGIQTSPTQTTSSVAENIGEWVAQARAAEDGVNLMAYGKNLKVIMSWP